jgi:hypothetical protein
MNNIILKNGIFGGLVVSAVMCYVTYSMKSNPDMEPNMYLGFGSMLVAFSFIVFGILQQRKANNDVLNFGSAFKTGVLIALITSTIYVLVWLVIFYNFFPDFIERYGEIMVKNTPAEDLAAKQEELEWMKGVYKSPLGIIGMTYVEILPLGIVAALVSAFILKKK